MTARYITWATMALALAAQPALADSDTLEADWLYLTTQGSWIERSVELTKASETLPLPVTDLSASAFWWQADDSNLLLSWQAPESSDWLMEGQLVQVDDWPGSWAVEAVSVSNLVLSQDGVQRALPEEQWYRLSWLAGPQTEDAFELTVQQQAAISNAFRYAWFDGSLGAEVRYSLELEAARPTLRQQLVLHNNSDYSIMAPGYSFAQSRSQGRMMLARSESMAMSDMSVAEPKAGDSAGQATLQSDQPMQLPAGSHAWLTVQETELSAIRHHYRFDWNTRQSGTLPGRWSLTLISDDDLPSIGGPVQVAVWDQQVALLETHYQPQQSTRSELSLGASDMMTLATETLGSSEWELVLTNRNSRSAEAILDLSHWNNDRNAEAGFSLSVPAQSTQRLQVRLNDGQLSVRPL
ncbi:hypothetical protein BGP77_14290 [Saccharospirillum sp. MSK14-1]|uniref:hypothetical protein n=1 Tax=Saccharospirillum sp. MSK14-1 TaxID=1897632 RepID=UPI000D39A052|nr:hypothetical protein [Saccharospirillum sp. MSK14-1]PTY37652.1 hypothetical protein BGP77_14290 [Saccharospirillum sp. MSK14-1]